MRGSTLIVMGLLSVIANLAWIVFLIWLAVQVLRAMGVAI